MEQNGWTYGNGWTYKKKQGTGVQFVPGDPKTPHAGKRTIVAVLEVKKQTHIKIFNHHHT